MPASQYSRALATFAALMLCQQASAEGFDMFSRPEELQNQVILDAGDFEKISPPSGKLGASEVLKLKSNCFEPLGSLGSSGYGKSAGLVIMNKEKSIKVALIESSMGSIKIQVTAVIQVACPTADSYGLPTDPQQWLQELRRKQEALQKELERLRQPKQ